MLPPALFPEAEKCVTKIFTDLAVINVTEEGLELVEVAPDISPEEVQSKTEAPLRLASNLTVMNVPERFNQLQLVNH